MIRTNHKTSYFRWLLLAFFILVLAACGSSGGDTSLPEGCDGITWGNDIQVEERGDEVMLLIAGDYPDTCSTVCGSQQTVDGNEINIDLFSAQSGEDEVCGQMLTPFRVEVELDTSDLEAGEYTITLNETHATTTFMFK